MEIKRKLFIDFYLANAPSNPEAVARYVEYIKTCPSFCLEEVRDHIQSCIDVEAKFKAGIIPALVHREPPAHIKPHSYDIPNTNMRLLFHPMVLPDTPEYAYMDFQWQFYVRGKGQDLDHVPVVELEGPTKNDWHVMTVYIAHPGSVIRVDRHELPPFPQDPKRPSMPL